MRIERFGHKEWILSGILVEIILFLTVQLILNLLPSGAIKSLDIEVVTELKFVEFEEIKTRKVVQTKDLSDTIIEKDKIEKEKKYDWNKASDPTIDPTQRYRPLFRIVASEDDYPDRARHSNLPRVVVHFTMLISPAGKIQDIRIRKIQSEGDAHRPYEDDFIKAVRHVILNRTQLLTKPYNTNGSAVPFTWDSKFEFILR